MRIGKHFARRPSRIMRGKDFNTGLRGVLFEARHYQRMGSAIWLYGWLVLRQTHQHSGLGFVLGGSPVSYREIEEETGFNRRTLECWMRVLRRKGYIETSTTPGGVIVRITKAKKFAQGVRNTAEGVRESAGSVRKGAAGFPRSHVASRSDDFLNQQVADRIGSLSVEGIIDKDRKTENANSSCGKLHKAEPHQDQRFQSFKSQNVRTSKPASNPEPYRPDAEIAREQYRYLCEARKRWEELSRQREEDVRRELYVGTSPNERGRRL